jgi:predicted DNA-binding transcriptional regulator AlpA
VLLPSGSHVWSAPADPTGRLRCWRLGSPKTAAAAGVAQEVEAGGSGLDQDQVADRDGGLQARRSSRLSAGGVPQRRRQRPASRLGLSSGGDAGPLSCASGDVAVSRTAAAAVVDLPRWLSIRQIADDLGVSAHTAYKWSARGEPWFPRTIRLRNGDIRVRRDWYEAWLSKLEQTS